MLQKGVTGDLGMGATSYSALDVVLFWTFSTFWPPLVGDVIVKNHDDRRLESNLGKIIINIVSSIFFNIFSKKS